MIPSSLLRETVTTSFPPVIFRAGGAGYETHSIVEEPRRVEGRCAVRDEWRGSARVIRIDDGNIHVDVCVTRIFKSSGSAHQIHAPTASIDNGELDLGADANWINHPALSLASESTYRREVLASWSGYPRIVTESVEDERSSTQPGFRLPQAGALHALFAHWSVKTAHAKIVLPTGTGKTDVMIAAMMLKPANRSLLLVPGDALRTQMVDRFAKLGKLRDIGALSKHVLNPVIGRLLKSPSNLEAITPLRSANVIVSTTQMLIGASDEELKEFLSWFDLVMFDEAHHLPAASWSRISKLTDDETRILSVTATPYRNDGRRIPGELIYQFPLRMAQNLGYFSTIAVVRVDELDPSIADASIARSAVDALRRDETEHGNRHLIMARARTKEHAEALHVLYGELFPELNPVLLHSGISAGARKSALDGIGSFTHRVVVCVDMLGEGVDIPALKIAALHDSHRSLPITLQFIGRFTRSSSDVGGATVILNIAETMANTAVAELFSEDADWNSIVPDLSARASGREESSAAFISSMQSLVDPEGKKFDLSLLSAKSNASFYTANQFLPGRAQLALASTSTLHQSWVSEERDLLVLITHDLKYPAWSTSREAASFEWNLSIVAHDHGNRLLYLNTTYGDQRASRLAKAIGGDDAALVSGERMFRVFEGLHRSVLYNAGLYRRGQLRFQSFAGIDIGALVSGAVQTGSTKSNLFAIGYEDGSKANIGASFKGRIWSMSKLSIPEWREWCNKAAKKILDESIATNSFLQFTLIPQEISTKPNADPFTCIPPDELLPGFGDSKQRITCLGDATEFTLADLSFEDARTHNDGIRIELSLGASRLSRLLLTWNRGFQVSHESGDRFFITDASEVVELSDFLTRHPPAVMLNDGSEVIGRNHFSYPTQLPYTFSPDSIRTLDWGETPLRWESKWRNGENRPSSVQGFMIERLLEQDGLVIFDDDDTGEAADIIVLTERSDLRELEIALYHCKYSSGAPGARFDDLYVVCGQAVKSSRLMHQPESLLTHMIRREGSLRGRPTRFERGTVGDVRALIRKIPTYRTRLSISIVQPGLSASAMTPELSTVLGAADGFVLDFTGMKLKVFGSH